MDVLVYGLLEGKDTTFGTRSTDHVARYVYVSPVRDSVAQFKEAEGSRGVGGVERPGSGDVCPLSPLGD